MFVVNILSLSLTLKPSKESNEALKFIKFKPWILKSSNQLAPAIQHPFFSILFALISCNMHESVTTL